MRLFNAITIYLLTFVIVGTIDAAPMQKTMALKTPCDEKGLTNQQKSRVISFVQKAQAHIKLKGMDKATQDFMEPQRGFMNDHLYIFIIDDKQYSLANGGTPELAGKNLKTISYTHESAAKIYDIAKQGGGWVSYPWMNPKTHQLQCKSSWVTPFIKGIDNQWYTVGAGINH